MYHVTKTTQQNLSHPTPDSLISKPNLPFAPVQTRRLLARLRGGNLVSIVSEPEIG